MVRAGEATGRLHQSLREVADLQERQEEAARKLTAALTYPIFLTFVAVGSVAVLMGVVVPKFLPLLEGHETQLPWSTNLIVDLSGIASNYGSSAAIALVALLSAGLLAVRVDSVRLALDRFIIHAPWLGAIPREKATAQLARGLAAMLRGGLDLPSAIAMSADMVANRAVRLALAEALSRVRQGQRLADALQRARILAPMGQRLIRSGEESGRLAELAGYLAEQMERRLTQRIVRLLSLLEPTLVILLGIIVGGIVVSILTAMLTINELAL